MTRRSDADGSDSGQAPGVSSCTHERGPDEPPSVAVVRAVAAFTNTRPLDLDPLYDVVDPELLDGLFGDPDGPGEAPRSVTFGVDGCEVTVTRDAVTVRPAKSDSA